MEFTRCPLPHGAEASRQRDALLHPRSRRLLDRGRPDDAASRVASAFLTTPVPSQALGAEEPDGCRGHQRSDAHSEQRRGGWQRQHSVPAGASERVRKPGWKPVPKRVWRVTTGTIASPTKRQSRSAAIATAGLRVRMTSAVAATAQTPPSRIAALVCPASACVLAARL